MHAAPSINTLTPARKDWLAILLLLLIACLAYWPLTFHIFSLKNDALNYFLPVRFQVSEAIHSHHYPFWSPYFNLGYALHGDMQSGVWNPIVQFFSIFGPYTLYKLQLETLFYIFLSGAGMYVLLRQARMQVNAALFASVAYMLCGFISDCCQYLNWISSAAFLPFVVLFYYKTLKEKKIVHSLAAGFFLYLMFVCAYPAHFVVTLYLLAAVFVYHLVLRFREGNSGFRAILTTALLRQVPAVICFLVLSAPAILSYIQYLQLSERGDGTNYANAMSNPLHPLLLMAYFTPLSIHSMPYVDITDGLERNSYFGVITFSFTLAAFFIRTSDPRVKFSRAAFIIFQVMSLGQFGGLRSMAYYLLPLMDTFRHPASIKLFTIFFGCILAAWSMHAFTIDRQHQPKIKKTALVSLIILAILFLSTLTGGMGILGKFRSLLLTLGSRPGETSASLKAFLGTLSFKELLFADSLMQLGFITLLLFHLSRKRNYEKILFLNILNCTLYVFLFTPFTVVKKDSAASIQRVLDQNIVKGYPLPSLTTSLAVNSLDDSSRFDEIGCLNMYNKQPGRNSYRISPCNLLSQNQFWSDTSFRNIAMGYPLLYRPDTLVPRNSCEAILSSHPGWKIGVVEDLSVRVSVGSHLEKDTDSLSATAFKPGYFRFSGTSGQPAFYIFQQNFYPLWKLYIDGKETPIVHCNIAFMGLQIPAGHHTIEFVYRPLHIILAFWLNIGLTLLLLFFFVRQYSRSKALDFEPSSPA